MFQNIIERYFLKQYTGQNNKYRFTKILRIIELENVYNNSLCYKYQVILF